ncbi:MAG: hypothetical protein M3Y65_05880 [Pseudomonadota bacterium]|nr:hypothetical protein [Pseudomonadota bacterium]
MNSDPRNDTSTAEHINHALDIVEREGVGPALTFMNHAGVPHHVALRVLTAPRYVRCTERRTR